MLGSLLLCLLACSGASGDADPGDVVSLQHLLVTTHDQGLPARDAALPSQHLRAPRSFKQFEARGEFTIRDTKAHALWGIYIVAFSHGGTVRVNGVRVGDVATSTPATTVWHTRPYLFTVPNSLLRDGTNVLELGWGARESLTLLSRIYVGPYNTLLGPYGQRLFWQNTMAEVALVHALVIATILLGIYSLRRHQRHYLTLGLGAIGFAIIVLAYMLPPMPYWAYPLWRATHIGGIALFTCGAWLFLIQEAQPRNRWFARFCLAWAALGPLAYLVHFAWTDLSFFRSFETTWGVISGLIGLYPVGLLLGSLWRRWDWRHFVFVLATSVAIVMGVADVLLQGTAKSLFGNVGYSLQTVSPLWFTALTLVLMMDFASSLVKESEQRRNIREQLDQQRSELAALYEASRVREHEHAVLQERQRIMQDIHDGLGSQLVSSLAMSEAGELDARQTSHLLRDCIDDLRLAIDALSDDGHSFWLAVGNLRFRMTPRMKAAGIELQWQRSDMATERDVPVAQTLAILRVIQEALTNALKHAGATRVSVRFELEAAALTITIEDNGAGFDTANTSLGKGISGMHKRARALHATLTVRSRTDGARHGTTVTLRVPLPHAADSA